MNARKSSDRLVARGEATFQVDDGAEAYTLRWEIRRRVYGRGAAAVQIEVDLYALDGGRPYLDTARLVDGQLTATDLRDTLGAELGHASVAEWLPAVAAAVASVDLEAALAAAERGASKAAETKASKRLPLAERVRRTEKWAAKWRAAYASLMGISGRPNEGECRLSSVKVWTKGETVRVYFNWYAGVCGRWEKAGQRGDQRDGAGRSMFDTRPLMVWVDECGELHGPRSEVLQRSDLADHVRGATRDLADAERARQFYREEVVGILADGAAEIIRMIEALRASDVPKADADDLIRAYRKREAEQAHEQARTRTAARFGASLAAEAARE